MKNLLLGSLCLFLVVGCQTYPKKPTYVGYGKFQPINHYVPSELQPFELPPKPEYIEGNQSVPKQIIVVTFATVTSDTSIGSLSATPVTITQPISLQNQVVIKEASDVKD